MYRHGRNLEAAAAKGAYTLGEVLAYQCLYLRLEYLLLYVLSLIPILTIAIALITMLGMGEDEINALLSALVPDAFDDFVHTLVSEAYEQSGIAFSLSTLTLLWSSAKGAKALRGGLNAAYDTEETRNAVFVSLLSVVAVLVLDVLLVVVLYLVFGDNILDTLSSHVPGLGAHDGAKLFLNAIATIGVALLGFMLCYTYLPAGKRRFLAQFPGAACAVIACGLLSFGFSIYVDYFCNYAVLYGSLATIVLFLFWMCLLFYVILIGGFINRLATEKKAERLSHRGAPR